MPLAINDLIILEDNQQRAAWAGLAKALVLLGFKPRIEDYMYDCTICSNTPMFAAGHYFRTREIDLPRIMRIDLN